MLTQLQQRFKSFGIKQSFVAVKSVEQRVKEINSMSFWTTFENDINKGLEVAGITVGTFVPKYSNLFMEIAQSFAAIEQIFQKPVTDPAVQSTVSAVVQANATLHAVQFSTVNKSVPGNTVNVTQS
jgi:hypothetical protein